MKKRKFRILEELYGVSEEVSEPEAWISVWTVVSVCSFRRFRLFSASIVIILCESFGFAV